MEEFVDETNLLQTHNFVVPHWEGVFSMKSLSQIVHSKYEMSLLWNCLCIYLFISLPHKYIIIFEWNKDIRSYIWCTCSTLPPWHRGSAYWFDGAYLFRVVSSFRDNGITSFSVRCQRRLLRPVYFRASSLLWIFFITLENHEPSSGVEPWSSRSVVRSSSTALASPGSLHIYLLQKFKI
jgi:hypothetical protein